MWAVGSRVSPLLAVLADKLRVGTERAAYNASARRRSVLLQKVAGEDIVSRSFADFTDQFIGLAECRGHGGCNGRRPPVRLFGER